MAIAASERVPVTFHNTGPYPITIGAEVVPPGGSVRHDFERSELPAGWDHSEIEISLGAPEQGVISRSPLGLIDWVSRSIGPTDAGPADGADEA